MNRARDDYPMAWARSCRGVCPEPCRHTACEERRELGRMLEEIDRERVESIP